MALVTPIVRLAIRGLFSIRCVSELLDVKSRESTFIAISLT
jgi:hypothetical protein